MIITATTFTNVTNIHLVLCFRGNARSVSPWDKYLVVIKSP